MNQLTAADVLAKDAVPSEPNVPAIPTTFKLGEQHLLLFATIAQFEQLLTKRWKTSIINFSHRR